MEKPSNDFVSQEKREFKWKLGTILASALSGFIAGILVSIAFFLAVFDLTLK